VVRVSQVGKRRRRQEGGRLNKTVVKFSDEEFARVQARAAAVQRTVPALLADLVLAPAQSPVLDPATARQLLVELFAIRRGLDKVGRNVNDIARFALGTGEVRANAALVLAALGPELKRLDVYAEGLVEYFPGLEVVRR
jgi:hypothetical protein